MYFFGEMEITYYGFCYDFSTREKSVPLLPYAAAFLLMSAAEEEEK